MHRIAIMLALHNNPEQANIFIGQCLQYKGAEVFIHIDRKGTAIADQLTRDNRIHILSEGLDVQWGDISQVKCILALMRQVSEYEAEAEDRFDYVSIHSGSDLFVKPVNEFISFLEADAKFAYLDCHQLPWKDWQYGGGLGRLALRWPAAFRRRLKRWSLTHICRAIYGRMYGWGLLRGRKLPEELQFWGKSSWFTISDECLQLCLQYLDENPGFLSFFEDTLCSDEIFFNTLINIVGEGKEIQEHDNLLYDDMENHDKKNSGSPKTMEMEDIDRIEVSGAFFARKFDMNTDRDVVDYYIRKTTE